MRLGIITQNTIEGGLDTFLINLISNINNHDIVLFYNKNKNIDKLKYAIEKNNIKIVRYPYKISNNLNDKTNKLIKKILNIYFFTFNIYFLSRKLTKIFYKNKLDTLLVVNGGYPGGEVCLSSIIAWSKINKNKKAYLNIHNYPIPLKNFTYLRKVYENYLDKIISKSSEIQNELKQGLHGIGPNNACKLILGL